MCSIYTNNLWTFLFGGLCHGIIKYSITIYCMYDPVWLSPQVVKNITKLSEDSKHSQAENTEKSQSTEVDIKVRLWNICLRTSSLRKF